MFVTEEVILEASSSQTQQTSNIIVHMALLNKKKMHVMICLLTCLKKNITLSYL